MRKKNILSLLFFLIVSLPCFSMDSIEKQMQDIENRLNQQMQEVEDRINQSFGLDFFTPSSSRPNNHDSQAEKILKQGLGEWIWYGRIYESNSPKGTKYIPLSLKKSHSGARLMVYVFMSATGQINLQPRLVFDHKYDIRQESHAQKKIARIEGRFDRLSTFEENMSWTADGSDKTMYILGRDDGYKAGRYERRSIMWMLLESRKFSIQFASETGSFSTAIFYLDGLEDMILKSITVLSSQQNRRDNPQRLLDQFVDRADRNLI